MSEKIKRKIVLEDGSVYEGFGFGAMSEKKVELVFNTSMVGYQEIISDPSYTYQTVVMTYPLIGNYGICDEDYETLLPTISGLVVKEYCDEPSNFRSKETLSEVMKKYDIVGIEGPDTRMMTRHIRDYGSCKAYVCDYDKSNEEAVAELKAWVPETDAVKKVSTKEAYRFDFTKNDITTDGSCANIAAGLGITLDENTSKWRGKVTGQGKRVVAIDCGMKRNIPRSLAMRGCEVIVVPYNTSAEDILAYKPDGVFISNGPGDPTDVQETIETIRNLIGKKPIFGICLGHQIISLAYGAKTYKLKFGHRGGNHPVKNLKNDKLEITSQNHSYAVDEESLVATKLKVTHINLLDNTIEGVECVEDKVFSVQYHPESAPGPQDSAYLFDDFMTLMQNN